MTIGKTVDVGKDQTTLGETRMTLGKTKMTLGKTKPRKLFLEGSFNPYGNGQIITILNGARYGTFPGTGVQDDVVCFVAPVDGTYDFGTMRAQLIGAVSTAANTQVALQFSIVPSGGVAPPVTGLQSGSGVGVGFTADPSTKAWFSFNGQYVSGSLTVGGAQPELTARVGSHVMAVGDTAVVSLNSNYLGAGTSPAWQLVWSTYDDGSTGGGASATTNVNVVGVEQLDAPIWTTTVNPKVPVMDPDLSGAVMEGSFNPYGNGQGDSLESTRLNPYSGETEQDLLFRLLNEASKLPEVSAEYAVCAIDPAATMMEYPDSFDHAETREQSEKENRRVAQEAKGREQTQKGGSPSATSDTAVKDRRQTKARQLKGVVTRLASKVSSWGDVVRILVQSTGSVDVHMASSLVEACQKKGLPGNDSADAYVARSLAAGRDDGFILCGLSSWNRVMADLKGHPHWDVWYKTRFSGSKPRVTSNEDPIPREDVSKIRQYSSPRDEGVPYERDTSDETKEGSFNPYGNGQGEYFAEDNGAKEMAARVHNKLMHALHGNTTMRRVDFPNSMEDITGGSTDLKSVFDSAGTVAGPYMDPVFEVTEQTGIQGAQGVTMSSVPRETALRGGIVDAANAITTVNDLNSPEALLWPLQVRDGIGGPSPAGELIDSTNRPETFGVGLVRRTALNPAVLSSEGAAIAELVSRQANIRPNQATAGGFLTSDLAALIRLQPEQNGDSIVSLLLKSYLYQMSRCWVSDPNFLPIGGEPGKFDSFTSLAQNPTVGTAFNPLAGPAATLWNINCEDGVTPGNKVFPYTGGLAPTIAFHVCKATVPANEAFFFLRPGLLMQNDAGQESINIALCALLLAPYPCGIHQVAVSTVNSLGADNDQQTYVPLSDLVTISGTKTINIVLPNKYPAGPPTSQAAANAQALVSPTGGPDAVPDIGGPYANLNVSYIDNVITYDLANYLNTWMATTGPIDLTTLSRFSLQLCEIFQRDQDRRFAWELASTIGTRYPAMFASQPGVPSQVPVNSDQSVASQSFFALKPRTMTQDYPEQIDSYDFFVPDMNSNWWSKIMSGAFVSTPDHGQYPVTAFPFDGSPRTLQYTIHQVRYYAMAAEACFTYMQMPTEVWNGAFTQLNFTSLLDMIRGFFSSSTQSVMDPLMSENGYSMALAHSRITGTRPACDMYGGSIYDYLNVPRVGFQPVLGYGGTEYIGVTPGVLADVWYQINNKFKCIAYMPLLSAQKKLTGIHIENGQVTPLGAGSYTSPIPVDSQARAVGLTTIPTLDDKAMFNAKLVWNVFNSTLYKLDGTVYNTGVIPAGLVVAQKYILPDWTVPALVLPDLVTSKTNWIPFMNIDGDRLVVGLTAANGAALMTQVMAAKTTSGAQMWLINGSFVMPNNIVMSGGTNSVSRMARRPGMSLNGTSSSDPVAEEAATHSAEDA